MSLNTSKSRKVGGFQQNSKAYESFALVKDMRTKISQLEEQIKKAEKRHDVLKKEAVLHISSIAPDMINK